MLRRRTRSEIGVANEKVSIVLACNLIGMDIPEDVGSRRSVKVHCPFGEIYHVDQGYEAAFRIYPDSNSAFCFAGCGYFTPVSLCAHAWGTPSATVAVELLERVGVKPVSLADAWAQVASHEPAPDAVLLAQALKTFCRRTCLNWEQIQFEPAVAATLTRCLALLDLVGTEADAGTWLAACKRVMSIAVNR
jgi:hypothetical protein